MCPSPEQKVQTSNPVKTVKPSRVLCVFFWDALNPIKKCNTVFVTCPPQSKVLVGAVRYDMENKHL